MVFFQFISGTDIGILLIDVLKKSDCKPIEFFEKLINLFRLMNPTSPERETFVIKAVKWSSVKSAYKNGHPDLHKQLAQVYWKGMR